MTEFVRGCITGFFLGIGLVFMFGVFLYARLDSIKGDNEEVYSHIRG